MITDIRKMILYNYQDLQHLYGLGKDWLVIKAAIKINNVLGLIEE